MTGPSKTAAIAAFAASVSAAPVAAQGTDTLDDLGYVVQFVRFESNLSREEVLAAANVRRPHFEAMPGLVQKYYLELEEHNSDGGIDIWESKEAMAAFRQSDVFKGIPAAYGIASQPQVDIIPVLFPPR